MCATILKTGTSASERRAKEMLSSQDAGLLLSSPENDELKTEESHQQVECDCCEKEHNSASEGMEIMLTDENILADIRKNRDASIKRDLDLMKGLCVPDPDPFDVFPEFGHHDEGDRDGPPTPMSMERHEDADRLQVVPYKTVSAPSWLSRTTDTVKYSLISRQT